MRYVSGPALALAFIMFMAALPPSLGVLGQGGIRTTVSVSNDPTDCEVDTSPTGDSKVYINVTVTVTAWPGAQTMLEISVDSGDWSNEIDQSVRTITGSNDAVFLVTVTAPFGTAGGMEQTVNMTVDWRTTSIPPDSGTVSSASNIEVKTFYAVNLYIPTTWRSAKQGENVDLEIKVYNKGNADDLINIWLENEKELEGDDWVVSIDDISANLPPNNSSRTMIHITVPEDATPDVKVIIIIKAKSKAAQDDGEKIEDTANITINVKASGGNNGGGGGNDTNGTDPNDTRKEKPICSVSIIFVTMPVALVGVAYAVGRKKRKAEPPWR